MEFHRWRIAKEELAIKLSKLLGDDYIILPCSDNAVGPDMRVCLQTHENVLASIEYSFNLLTAGGHIRKSVLRATATRLVSREYKDCNPRHLFIVGCSDMNPDYKHYYEILPQLQRLTGMEAMVQIIKNPAY